MLSQNREEMEFLLLNWTFVICVSRLFLLYLLTPVHTVPKQACSELETFKQCYARYIHFKYLPRMLTCPLSKDFNRLPHPPPFFFFLNLVWWVNYLSRVAMLISIEWHWPLVDSLSNYICSHILASWFCLLWTYWQRRFLCASYLLLTLVWGIITIHIIKDISAYLFSQW